LVADSTLPLYVWASLPAPPALLIELSYSSA
jgi:hypothetical protein